MKQVSVASQRNVVHVYIKFIVEEILKPGRINKHQLPCTLYIN